MVIPLPTLLYNFEDLTYVRTCKALPPFQTRLSPVLAPILSLFLAAECPKRPFVHSWDRSCTGHSVSVWLDLSRRVGTRHLMILEQQLGDWLTTASGFGPHWRWWVQPYMWGRKRLVNIKLLKLYILIELVKHTDYVDPFGALNHFHKFPIIWAYLGLLKPSSSGVTNFFSYLHYSMMISGFPKRF